MVFHQILLVATILLAGASASCDRNLIDGLNYRISGRNVLFPCESTKNIYTNTGRYVPKNVIPTRMQILKDEAIVALPRYKHGVPFTLAKFCLKNKGCDAVLEPYPCWGLQEEGNCEAIQSANDIFLDNNQYLWVLDTGIVNTLEQPVRRCAPKCVAIDTKTGQVLKTIDLSPYVSKNSRFQYLVVDYTADGSPFVYVGDAGVGAIVVYDVFNAKGYRVVLPQQVCNDHEKKDVLNIALIRKPCGNVLYFTYLSCPKIFSIKTKHLQSGDAAGAVKEVGVKPTGTVLLGTDNGPALFFRYKGESDIYVWNTETCFKQENFVLAQKGSECRLPTQVVPGYKRFMWAIESNFHDFIAGTDGCFGPSVVVHPVIKTCDN